MNWDRLKLMRAAARVKRCHTMTSIHQQTVGEHTFGLIAILLEILKIPEDVYEVHDPYKIMLAAMYHDVPEAITGDTPSPAKWKHSVLEQGLKQAEQRIAQEFNLIVVLSEFEKKFLKYADIMELAMYAMEEVETGNTSMAVVFRNAMTAIKDRGLIDLTPSSVDLYEMVLARYELKFSHDLGKDVTHGWPDY